ncbi:MAG: hypothetical protein A2172_00880 [Candidatus Woykebacteria bacterium RBG_13_40_15]|uniref:Uncharacterized protein n=1 Tax=Candidatus Woykebacteria bacterium RBG_13_40_15 TaxID=1802593 RepID=A0A1G1W8T1_9BACT|nr:MAG: hypothetical protein A2172_00880 [Candidatus Woykebacteria bacterium RBG_13_40_15]
MDKEVFKQFKQHFGEEWSCNCGSSFESEWLEIMAQTDNSLLARYNCQVCGGEQFFAVGVSAGDKLNKEITEVPMAAISSDDALDIKSEISKLTFKQIRALGRRKVIAKTSIQKPTRG